MLPLEVLFVETAAVAATAAARVDRDLDEFELEFDIEFAAF